MELKNLRSSVTSLNGKKVMDGKKSVTVGRIIATCVSGGYEGMTLEEQVRINQLSRMLFNSKRDSLQVGSKSMDIIRKSLEANRVGYPPLIIGQAALETGLEVAEIDVTEPKETKTE